MTPVSRVETEQDKGDSKALTAELSCLLSSFTECGNNEQMKNTKSLEKCVPPRQHSGNTVCAY